MAVIGVVEGDLHDIGKNIVAMMLDAAGFDVRDLGRSVTAERFVTTAAEAGAAVLGLSSLMTTTRQRMSEVIELVASRSELGGCSVMIGGAAVTPAFAAHVQAAGYARDAIEAVELAQRFVAEGKARDAH